MTIAPEYIASIGAMQTAAILVEGTFAALSTYWTRRPGEKVTV
jgi:hypothetical protein